MQKARISGPGAGVYKYDILTALTMWGLRGLPAQQVSAMRLVAMVTARYNWQRDEISIGHKDLARLWGVTERTAKRETKRLADQGLLELVRPGVRGRVACYRLVTARIAEISAPHWECVGPDFVERFRERQAASIRQEGPSVVRVDFARLRDGPEPDKADDPWSTVQARLRGSAPEVYSAWFAGLRLSDVRDDTVVVTAPSAFVGRYVETHFGDMLSRAVAEVFGAERRLVLGVAG